LTGPFLSCSGALSRCQIATLTKWCAACGRRVAPPQIVGVGIAALLRGPEPYMTGGASAERSSSRPGEGAPKLQFLAALVPGLPSAWYRVRVQQTHLEQPLDGEEGSRELCKKVLSDLMVSTYSYSRE